VKPEERMILYLLFFAILCMQYGTCLSAQTIADDAAWFRGYYRNAPECSR
jgi:hypothetical protein